MIVRDQERTAKDTDSNEDEDLPDIGEMNIGSANEGKGGFNQK